MIVNLIERMSDETVIRLVTASAEMRKSGQITWEQEQVYHRAIGIEVSRRVKKALMYG